MKTNPFLRRQSLRFRRLSRKSYAAFCSMHREVTIGRVRGAVANLELLKAGKAAILAVALLMTPDAFALEEPDDPGGTNLPAGSLFQIQEVQVVASKAELQSEAYRLVSTISHEQIAALPVSTVADIFQYLPGLDIRRRGANGAQTDLSMRGGTFDQVLVLLNGVPLNDAQTGHYSLHLPVSPLLIERIEVLQGAGAVTAGTGAFAGAVNIVTRECRVSPIACSLKLTAGTNAFVHPELAFSARVGEWQINTSAEYSRFDGYYAPAPSDKEREALLNNGCRWANVYARTRWRDLDIQLGAQYKDAGAGLFYGGSTDQFDATRTAFGSARYKHHWGAWSLEGKASYRVNHDHYQWHRGQPAGSNTHLLQTVTAGLNGAYISWLGTTTVGFGLRNENIRSTNLGDTNRVHLTYFGQQTFHYHGLSASVGLSGNYNTFFGNHLSGGANIGYEYLPGSSVYLNAQRAVRMPTVTDLNYDAGNQLGNRDLKPEKAWAFSLGGTYNYKGLTLTADAWYRLGTDIIDWVYVPSDTRRPYHAANQQRIHSAGTEITAVYRPKKMTKWSNDQINGKIVNDQIVNDQMVNGEWLRSVSLSYGYTWLDLDLHEVQSRYLDYLSHKLVLGIEHGIWVSSDPKKIGVIAASWTLRWQKREGDYTSAEGVVTSYKPVLLLDGSLYWQNDRVKISADCTNITNRHYYDYGSLLMPGAWGTLAIEVQL